MIKQTKGFVHLFLVIAVVVIGFSGLLYFSRQKGFIKTISNEKSSFTPTTSFNEKANWKTYVNSKLKFTFNYPDSILVDDDGDTLMLYWRDDHEALPLGYLYIPIGEWDKKFFYGGDYAEILPDLLKLRVGETYEFKVGATSWNQEITRLPDTQVGGTDSYVFNSDHAWDRPGPWKVIHVPLENDYLLVEITYKEDVDFDYEKVFDQTLSTFRFLN